MTKDQLRDAILSVLKESDTVFDVQVKAMAEARAAIQPRMSEGNWRAKAQPILKPKEKGKK